MLTVHFRRYVCCALALVVGATALAQDPTFTQYAAAATQTNPGLAGLYEGQVRLTANYRDQWGGILGGAPLRTIAASAEAKFSAGGRDYMVVAVDALHDQGGAARFVQNRAGLTLAYQKYLSGGRGRDAVVAGLGGRAAYGQHGLADDGLWYTSDFDSATVSVSPDGRAGGGLRPTGQTRGYLDLGAGGNLAVVKDDYSVVVGAAAHHVNQPSASFLFSNEARIPMRYVVMLGGEYLFRDNLRAIPSVLFQRQGASRQVTAGGGLYYRPDLRGDTGFRIGLYGRMSAAAEGGMAFNTVIVAGQIEMATSTIGLSYDAQVGSLGRATDGRGAYELSYAWRRPFAQAQSKVVCPRF